MNLRVVRLAAAAMLAGWAAGTAQAQEFAWRKDADSVALLHNGSPVWCHRHATNQTKPYFHPVALPGGPSLTWDSPPDHPWHHALWFSWKYINKLNYWEEDKKTGRPEGRTFWSNVVVETAPDFSAVIRMDVAYSPWDAAPVLSEVRKIEVSAPAKDGSYRIDWTSHFTALADKVAFDRTPPSGSGPKAGGGYAGLIARLSGELKDAAILNSEGVAGLDGLGRRAAACDYHGTIGGAPMGLAMIDHASNGPERTEWFLRMNPAVPFYCIGPGVIYSKPLTLTKGGTLNLRYRVIAHPSLWDAERLRKEAAAFR